MKIENKNDLFLKAAHLQSMFSKTCSAIYVKDSDSRYVMVSQPVDYLFQGSGEQIKFKTDHDIFSGDIADLLFSNDREVIERETPLQFTEMINSDGKAGTYITIKAPVFCSKGKVCGIFCISTDVSQKINCIPPSCSLLKSNSTTECDSIKNTVNPKKETRVSQEELRKERLIVLGQLTATVSHEIRNPLGTIRNSIFTIGERIRGKGLGVEKALARVERNILRCNDIIEGLLDYSSGRKLKLELTAIDQWFETLFDEQIIPTGVNFFKNFNSGAKIMIDRERVRRVVVNVCQNACDAMGINRTPEKKDSEEERRSKSCLTIETRVKGEWLEIDITDTGIGINDEVLNKIFEPLFSTKSFGVGLGLSVVKQIMEQHCGDVRIDSKRDIGTTVKLRFPGMSNVDSKMS